MNVVGMWLGMQMSGCHSPLRMQRLWTCLVDGELSKWVEFGGESVMHVVFPPGCRQRLGCLYHSCSPSGFSVGKSVAKPLLSVPSHVSDCINCTDHLSTGCS